MPTQSHEQGACLLIDDAGRLRRWPGPDCGAAFGYRDPDFDFVEYAVRNLGYVMIAERARCPRIRMRPVLVGGRTGDALLRHLAQDMPARIGLSVLTDTWHDALYPYAEARRRLETLLDGAAPDPAAAPFVAARRNIAAILDDPRDPFAPVLRRWLDGTYRDSVRPLLESCGLYERAMIVERREDSGDFVFRHSGERIQLYGSSWASAAVGRRLQDQPDARYGEWVADACRSVDDRQVPRYEMIAARVGTADRPARNWRYERLMLPWRDAAGRRLVISISRRERARHPGG